MYYSLAQLVLHHIWLSCTPMGAAAQFSPAGPQTQSIDMLTGCYHLAQPSSPPALALVLTNGSCSIAGNTFSFTTRPAPSIGSCACQQVLYPIPYGPHAYWFSCVPVGAAAESSSQIQLLTLISGSSSPTRVSRAPLPGPLSVLGYAHTSGCGLVGDVSPKVSVFFSRCYSLA